MRNDVVGCIPEVGGDVKGHKHVDGVVLVSGHNESNPKPV